MQAVILAAGQSSRFYPFNSLGHKSLITIAGKTLLQRTLASLRRAKVFDIVIVEDLDEKVSKSLTPEDLKYLKVKFVIQEKPTGMGDALLCASKYLQKSFFVLSAYHFEVDKFAKEMVSSQKKDTDIVLLTRKADDTSAFGTIVKKKGKLTVAEKKGGASTDAIIGIYLLNRFFVSTLSGEKKEHYSFENAITSYSDSNEVVLVRTNQETLSLKYPWDILGIKDYILRKTPSKISRLAKVSKKATVSKNVVIEEGATVMDGAVISGPAYIGKNAYVGTHSVVRAGVTLEEGAVVGAQMEVKNAVIMRKTTTHSGFIGDSVVGEKTRIAAGFHTANVRLDKTDVMAIVKGEKVSTKRKYFGAIIGSSTSFGIKVGTMPGVIVGNGCVIGPGTTVMENVEDDTTYYTEVKSVVKKRNKK